MREFISNVFSLRTAAPNSKNRIAVLDFIRGMGMLLVILGHAGVPGNTYLMLFRMPMFFLLSGYTEYIRGKSPRGADFLPYTKKRFFALMIPNWLFELVDLLLWCILCAVFSKPLPLNALKPILLCVRNEGDWGGLVGSFWFLPCMFVCSLLFFGIRQIVKSKAGLLTVALALFGLSWLTIRYQTFRFPLHADAAIFGTAFMILGYALGEWIRFVFRERHWLPDLALLLLCSGIVWIAGRNGAVLYMFLNDCRNMLLVIPAALAGSAAFFILCKYLFKAVSRCKTLFAFVKWYGFNSLAVFPVHLFLTCVEYLNIPGLSMDYWLSFWIFLSVCSVPVVNFITHYLPFMLGKPYPKKSTE